MFTHDQIWAAIDRLADSRGFSPSGLARQAGLDPTAFNRSKRISPNGKPRWPSTESLSKVLDVTDCTMSDLLSLMDQDSNTIQPVALLNYAALSMGHTGTALGTYTIALKAGDDAFAVEIEDDRMHPLFRSGSIIVADRGAKVKAQDRILLFSRAKGLKGGILNTAQKKTYSILLPDQDFRAEDFAESDVEWIARIVWASQ